MVELMWSLQDTTTGEIRSGREELETHVDAAFWIDGNLCDYVRADTFGFQRRGPHPDGCQMLPGEDRFKFLVLTVDGKDELEHVTRA
jgi:hypothetical protein